MFGLSHEFKNLHETGRRILVGLVGAGQMGTDIVSQVSLMPSQRIVSIADLDVGRARNAYRIAQHSDHDIVGVDSIDQASRAIEANNVTITGDYKLLTDIPVLEAVIEATGHPEASARTALRTIFKGKHLITLSVEMDVTVGPLLAWYARQHQVIYTLAAGDEPTALFELFDFTTALGLTVVAAGKGKNNPLNRDANPDDLATEAYRRGLTPEMLVEFVDGSKTMIEMASVSNATGMPPDIRGMHGPRINISEFKTVFAPRDQGGVLNQIGVVDYVIGDLAPGVFLVFTTDNARLREALILRDMGTGPNYVLLRPFHLCSMEVPLSVALAVLQKKATMSSKSELTAEVLTVAKRDLSSGISLERIGGRTHYGLIERADVASQMGALPLGLAKGAATRCSIHKGEVITYADVDMPDDLVVTHLRYLQDKWISGTLPEDLLLEKLDAMAASQAAPARIEQRLA